MQGNQKNINYQIKWTPEFAYAIGLLTTDGNLSKDGRHMILVSKDKEQIENFKKCLNLQNKIGSRGSGSTKGENYFHVQFSNTKLYKWFLEIGLHPNKSKTLGALKIPDKFFFHFLRGHFDGDGSCYGYWDKRWKSSFMFYVKFYSASKEHILWLRSKIKRLSGIRGDLSQNRKSSVYQLRYAKKESKILFFKMYPQKNLPCLERKYEKLKMLLTINSKKAKIPLKLSGRVMESVDIYA